MKFACALIATVLVAACSKTSSTTTTSGGDPNPPNPGAKEVLVKPKTVEDAISMMQFRTEGSCENRDLKIHYLATEELVGDLHEGVRIVLYGNGEADFQTISFPDEYSSAWGVHETNWKASGSKVVVDNLGTIEVSMVNGKPKAEITFVSDFRNAFAGKTMSLGKQVNYPNPKINSLDCLPNLNLHQNKHYWPSSMLWYVSNLSSPIQNRPSKAVVPEAFQPLVYKYEGDCRDHSRKELYWVVPPRTPNGVAERLVFYEEGYMRRSNADGLSSDIFNYWRVSNGKVEIFNYAYSNGEDKMDFDPNKIVSQIDLSGPTPTITFTSTGKTYPLERHYDLVKPGIGTNSCR